ncbi:MAG TPA: bifunctional metallophosphatase/5'-nucleotidase [Polyangiales bacterium]|nr:bifunctional metallophosphatase/5'-nucleotidase [Polyangiales bacterium]
MPANDCDRTGSARFGLVALVASAAALVACTDATDSAPTTRAALAVIPAADSCQGHADVEHDSLALRAEAAKPVHWRRYEMPRERELPVKILGWNDFHGQLSPKTVSMRPAGGAAVMASYLRAAAAKSEYTFLVHAGDHVGASPPNSALLQDEPSISYLNLLANEACGARERSSRCNLVGTLGNHEFDEGKDELLRLIDGGNHASGPYLEDLWDGAHFPYVSANVIDADSGETLLPPYKIVRVPSVPIAFIGAVLKNTPTIVTPTGVAGLTFLDEADAINSYIPELHAQGVHTIIVLIHQGLTQTSYTGPTDAAQAAPSGELLDVISRLDDDIDVIVSGHTHQFTNAILENANGVPMLVTQAFSASTAYAEIDLVLDTQTNDVVTKTASVVTTWGDEGPGLTPDENVAALVARADESVAPRVNRIVGQAASDITRTQNTAGESALGNLIADSQRASVGAQFGVMNPGGIRADLPAGEVTWGELFAIQPFGNTVVTLILTGQQLYDLLNQQWGGMQPAGGRLLQISGFGYTWDSTVPEGGARVVEVHAIDGMPIALDEGYVVAANNFIAAGGDNFTVLTAATNQVGGPVDMDALVAYLGTLAQPFDVAVEGRIAMR